jgi:hypothetical protein
MNTAVTTLLFSSCLGIAPKRVKDDLFHNFQASGSFLSSLSSRLSLLFPLSSSFHAVTFRAGHVAMAAAAVASLSANQTNQCRKKEDQGGLRQTITIDIFV